MAARPTFPLVCPIECSDPLDVLPTLARLRYPFLLHSSLDDERGRWSFFGAEPFELFRGRNYEVAVGRWRSLSERAGSEDATPTLVPFTGGVVGYWSYDFGRRLERWPERAADDLGLPDFVLGFYDVVGAFDHQSRRAWLFSTGLPYDRKRRLDHAQSRLEQFEAWLAPCAAIEPLHGPRHASTAPGSTFSPDAYRGAVEAVKQHIARGDIYQANLSQRWTLPLAGPSGALGGPPLDAARIVDVALSLHAALVQRSPAPFAAFFAASDHAVVSSSPERFLELRARHVETRPIKGTRPRGGTSDEDLRLRRELEASAKDRAENVMIVDVLRNDLGRVCEAGTVRASSLCELEAFPQVFHLTSSVEGTLGPDADAFDLLHACFPGGSITGAPKLRAIEILESLEPVRRHVYTGSLGYVDWRGDADWNIAIRTALVTPRALHFAAGGGITADSDPDAEHEETLHKAAGMRAALASALGVAEDALEVAS